MQELDGILAMPMDMELYRGFELRLFPTDSGPKVIISPGVAYDPRGHEVLVPQRCAVAHAWGR